MLTNGKDLLLERKKEKKAIFQFNINNLEWTKNILLECNKLNEPVILGVSESAINYMGGYNVVYSIVNSLINDLNIKVEVVLHLDHGKSVESCIKAINAGFTSVMIDASNEYFEKNIEITKEVVKYAHLKNVVVEAELGVMGELKNNNFKNSMLTNKEDCIKFIHETNVDSLAPSVGTVHGLYTGELNIDYGLMREISSHVDKPLVLHGGSGLSNDILKKCVESGITKININSDLQDKWSKCVRVYLDTNKEVIDPRKIIESGMNDLKQEIDLKMNINN